MYNAFILIYIVWQSIIFNMCVHDFRDKKTRLKQKSKSIYKQRYKSYNVIRVNQLEKASFLE